MKTTVDIPDRLFKLLRVRAAAEQTTMRELLTAALRQFLGGPGAPRKKFKLKDGSVRGEGLTEEFRGAEWSRMREEIYRGRGGEM